jgi:hypothetical protein
MTDGLCECGCGQTTGVWTRNDRGQQRVKGQHKRFIDTHQGRMNAPRDEAHHNWRGEKANIRSIHFWVDTHKPKSGSCSHCGRSTRTEWANVSGEYKRDINDYIELCPSCHKIYDQDGKHEPRARATGGSVSEQR